MYQLGIAGINKMKKKMKNEYFDKIQMVTLLETWLPKIIYF